MGASCQGRRTEMQVLFWSEVLTPQNAGWERNWVRLVKKEERLENAYILGEPEPRSGS